MGLIWGGYGKMSYAEARDASQAKDIDRRRKEECGITAFSNMLTVHQERQRLFDFMAREGKRFDLCSRENNGLNANDIGAMASRCGYLADYRFNSQIRTFSDFPLPSFVDGLVAVKQRNSEASHWLAWVGGKLISDSGEELSSTSEFPGFDGFGHRVALWRPGADTEIIRATSAVPCSYKYCATCFRSGSCHEER